MADEQGAIPEAHNEALYNALLSSSTPAADRLTDTGAMRKAIEAYLAAFDAGTGTVYVEPLMRAAIRNLPDAKT